MCAAAIAAAAHRVVSALVSAASPAQRQAFVASTITGSRKALIHCARVGRKPRRPTSFAIASTASSGTGIEYQLTRVRGPVRLSSAGAARLSHDR